MSYESMNIIEGKFKLPMLRGEHTQQIQHFREMEHLMATDLSNWLCNVYLEVRHMSLHELGATEEMLKVRKTLVNTKSDHYSYFFSHSFCDVNSLRILI